MGVTVFVSQITSKLIETVDTYNWTAATTAVGLKIITICNQLLKNHTTLGFNENY